MPLSSTDERTVKRALRAMLRDWRLKDPGPDATVEELIKLCQQPRKAEAEVTNAPT